MTKENGTATMNGNGHAEPTKTSPTGIKMSKEGMTGPLNTTHHVSSREERERKREREREAAWTSQPFVLLSLSHKRRTHIGNATFSLFSLSFVPSSLFPFVEKRREERGRESDRKRREILAFGNFLFSPSSLSNSSASIFFSSSTSFSFLSSLLSLLQSRSFCFGRTRSSQVGFSAGRRLHTSSSTAADTLPCILCVTSSSLA